MKNPMKHGAIQKLAAVLAIVLLSSCGGNGDDFSGTHVTRGLGGQIDTLDPHAARSVQAHKVLEDLFQGLLEYSADGRLQAGVAESWSVSDDGLVYLFKLREDSKWSNGDPVTADDFVYSLRRLVDPKTAAFYGQFVGSIENAPEILGGGVKPDTLGVRAIDEWTLEIVLSRPTPYFPQLLTHPATYPVHRGSIEEHGDRFARAENLVSNGAYTLGEWVINSIVSLNRNEAFWDAEKVKIDRVRWMPLADSSAEYLRYRAGELDITSNVSPNEFEFVKRDRPNELRVSPYLGLYYYGINLTKEPFKSNEKLRQALSMAVDREVLVERVTGRGEVAAYSWVPPGMEGYEPSYLSYKGMTRDERLAEARRLYKEAGYGPDNPLRVEIRYHTSDIEQTVALAIHSMWKENLGAEAELVNEEFKVLLSNIQQMAITEVYRLSWIGDYSDPDTFLQLMISDNPSNLVGYENSEFDELMKSAELELDEDERIKILQKAEQLMLSEHPAIPLYYYVSKHIVREGIEGWEPNILDRHPSKYLSIER
jgi:ABC-type oligopeptide transport system substrate-binding subunit